MYCSKIVKCASCGHKIKIEYDSKKKHQDEYICPCGRLIVRSNKYGSFIYSGNYIPLSVNNQESVTFQYDDDYIKLSDNVKLLLKEIFSLAKNVEELHEGSLCFNDYSDKNKLRLELCRDNSFEEISIIVDIKLCKNTGWSDIEQKTTNERILQALTRFKNILEKVINKEINLKYPSSFYNENKFEWNLCKKIRIARKGYDYFMYC